MFTLTERWKTCSVGVLRAKIRNLGSILLWFHSVKLLRYKYYERWATASDFPVENVVNDGSTTLENRLGAVADLELVTRSRNLQDDIMVVWRSYPQMLYLLEMFITQYRHKSVSLFYIVDCVCFIRMYDTIHMT